MMITGVKIGVGAVIALLAVCLPPAAAAGVSLQARVDRESITLNETVKYYLEIIGCREDYPEPIWPETEDYTAYLVGISYSHDTDDDRLIPRVRYEFTIVPRIDGTLTLGPVTYHDGARTYTAEPIVIEVKYETPLSKATPSHAALPGEERQFRVFARAVLDKDEVFVNQCVTLTLRLYCAEKLIGISLAEPPALTGFRVEELLPWRRDYRTIDGTRYELTEIDYALFPISAGEKEIGKSRLIALIEVPEDRESYADDIPLTSISVFTEPVKLRTLPLPAEGRPADFSGLVGTFNITTDYERTTVAVNEQLTARVTVSGRGNIKSVTAPTVTPPVDIRAYVAGSTEEIGTAAYQVRGSKTFEQVFVPRREGTVEIPGFSLSYYDPGQQQYITKRTMPVTVTVTAPAGMFGDTDPLTEPQEIAAIDKDVRFLKKGGDSFARGGGGFPYALMLVLHVIPLTGLGLVVLARRHREYYGAGGIPAKRRITGRDIQRRLARAGGYAAAGNAEFFYPAISDTLIAFFSARFDGPENGSTRSEIDRILTEAGIHAGLAAEFIAVLDACDYGRFGPGQRDIETMRELHRRAAGIIEKLEKTTDGTELRTSAPRITGMC